MSKRARILNVLTGGAMALVLATGCGGGFDDVDDPDGSSRLVGQALTVEREPVADAWAFLVKDGKAVAQGKTDANGNFNVTIDFVGMADLVLNDGSGNGALKPVALLDGENDAGALFMQPLESIAPVVDMQGIGFEERITTERGDYLRPVYNSDRSAVYTVRKKGGDPNYEVVRIDLPSGEETVLRSDENLYSNSSGLWLLSDDVLYYEATRPIPDDPNGYSSQSHVLVHTGTGEELFFTPWYGSRAGFHAVGNEICFVEGPERQKAYDTLFGWAYEYKLRPACLDPSTGEIRRGSLVPGWSTYTEVVGQNAERLAFLHVRDCDYEDENCQWDPPKPLKMIEWSDLSNKYVSTFEYGDRFALETSWNGKDLYFLDTDQYGSYPVGLKRVNVDTGSTRDVDGLQCDETSCVIWGQVKVAPGGTRLMAAVGRKLEDSTIERLGIQVVDTATGEAEMLDTSFEADGVFYTLCEAGDSPQCNPVFEADGDISMGEVFSFEDGATTTKTAVTVTLPLDGGAARVRALPIGEADYGIPQVIESPDGTGEIARLRDLETGFFQLHAGTVGGAADDLTPITFITASHHSLAFAPDGEHLYYFTRDPISGYEQLFRVAPSAPEDQGSR